MHKWTGCFIARDCYWPLCLQAQITPWETVASKLFTGVTALLMKRNFPSFQGPGRQKLHAGADRDILGASEYICNLKSAGTKSLSPLVVDSWWADEPQIWGATQRVQPSEHRIADKEKKWCRRRADWPSWTEVEHLARRVVVDQWTPSSHIYIVAMSVSRHCWFAMNMSCDEV